MRTVSNRTVSVLARQLPIVLAAVDVDSIDTRLANAVRMVGIELKLLKAKEHGPHDK